MSEVTKHEPGSFCWAELATSDPKAAKVFYTSLFGWTFVDNQVGPGPEDIYTRQQVMPPNWASYFTVENVDETTKKVKSNGGNVISEPFDVMGYGRMSVVQGPEGAVFCLWQAGTHIGFQRVGENSTAGWIELQTPDPVKSGEFLAQVIGWTLKAEPSGAYIELQRGGTSVAGIRPMGAGEAFPPHWLIYFQVSDCDAAAAQAKSLGANVLVPAMDVEKVGRFTVLADPQGAAFALIRLTA